MPMHHPTRRTLLSAAWLALCPTVWAADPPLSRELRLARNNDLTSVVNGMVLQELYRRAGIKLSVIEMPPARANIEAQAGRVDGEVNRIRSYGDNAPTLIRVEPSFHLWNYYGMYRKEPAIRVHGLADLGHYTVGYVRGIRFSEELVKPLSNTVATDNPEQLMKMLQSGRIDVAVGITRYEIRAFGMADDIDATVLTQTPLYHYLNEKHRELAPVIGAVIKKAADAGELEKLYAQYEKQLLDALPPPKR